MYCFLPLVRGCMFAYQLAEIDNKATSLAWDCGANIQNCYEMLAKDEIVDSSQSLHRGFVEGRLGANQMRTQQRTRSSVTDNLSKKLDHMDFLKTLVFISSFSRCSMRNRLFHFILSKPKSKSSEWSGMNMKQLQVLCLSDLLNISGEQVKVMCFS